MIRKTILKIVLMPIVVSIGFYLGARANEVLNAGLLDTATSSSNQIVKYSAAQTYLTLNGIKKQEEITKIVNSYIDNREPITNDWDLAAENAKSMIKSSNIDLDTSKVNFKIYRENERELNVFSKIKDLNSKSKTNNGGYYLYVDFPIVHTTLHKKNKSYPSTIFVASDFGEKITNDQNFKDYVILHELGHIHLRDLGKLKEIKGMDNELFCDKFSLGIMKTKLDKESYNRLVDNVVKLREQGKADKLYNFADEIMKLKAV